VPPLPSHGSLDCRGCHLLPSIPAKFGLRPIVPPDPSSLSLRLYRNRTSAPSDEFVGRRVVFMDDIWRLRSARDPRDGGRVRKIDERVRKTITLSSVEPGGHRTEGPPTSNLGDRLVADWDLEGVS